MNRRTRWLAIALVIVMLCSVCATGAALAQQDKNRKQTSKLPPGLQKKPLSDAYRQYVAHHKSGVVPRTPDGRALGWTPSPVELSRATASTLVVAQAQSYPASYDLRTLGRVSNVTDQGPCGSCWAHASVNAIESNRLVYGSATQYSENNVKNLNDFDFCPCCGGNALMATAYLARWAPQSQTDYSGNLVQAGPVTLSCDPYHPDDTGKPAGSCAAGRHVQNVTWLPLKANDLDNAAIKRALMSNGGAVYSAFQWESYSNAKTPYYNTTSAAYYNKYRAGGNHAVTIVGWNDNYPAKNFSTAPPGNGAWIVKNSWGTSWGKQGYFYVSYYDKNLGRVENAQFTSAPTSNFVANYQYDAFGMDTQWGYGWMNSASSSAYGANVFTATGGQTIKAIAFWAAQPGTSYSVKVYKNPTSTNPASGTLVSSFSGSVSYAGYYTKTIRTPVPVTAGQKFSIVIKFTTPGDAYPIPVQEYVSGFTSQAKDPRPGTSFVSNDGTSWYDLSNEAGYANVVNIHAFA